MTAPELELIKKTCEKGRRRIEKTLDRLFGYATGAEALKAARTLENEIHIGQDIPMKTALTVENCKGCLPLFARYTTLASLTSVWEQYAMIQHITVPRAHHLIGDRSITLEEYTHGTV